MSVGKISLLWKKLENALSLLAKSSQIWLLEKFLEEANKSGSGIDYTIITINIDVQVFKCEIMRNEGDPHFCYDCSYIYD